jgi:DNA-binding NtrC family response regulator
MTTAAGSTPPADLPAKPTLLVVDEDEAMALSLRRAAEAAGAKDVETAGTLDEALDTLGNASRRFDGILLAFGTTNRTGADLMKVLRAHRADLVVIAYGAPASHPILFRTFAPHLAGAAAVVAVPCDLAELLALSARALRETWTVRRVIDDQIAPPLLGDAHATLIYGVPAGTRFHARLD